MKLYKLKKDKVKDLREWIEELKSFDPLLLSKLLKEENCTKESMGLFEIDGEIYLIGHMEGGPFQKPSNNKINIKHKQVLQECIEHEVTIENLYTIQQDKNNKST